ncbi:zinc finger protein 260-like [Sabethes cyaneus]|uniref:zinc finger protein 260-like n=1 Tax=Sabethes cyaneus TaxID=53552 RepID=UPI00237D50DF|nr:zinc finger protein 260-like [Sabethes cyaneus]
MESLCRTCTAQIRDQKCSISVFSYTQEGDTIANLLLQYCLLKISEQDSLPKELCKICVENLLTVVSFRRKCVESEQTLRQMFEEEQNLPNLIGLESIVKPKKLEYVYNADDCELQKKEEIIESVGFETETTHSLLIADDLEYETQHCNNYNTIEMMSFRCCICATIFHNEEQHREHVFLSHNITFSETLSDIDCTYVCCICKHVFATLDELRNHQGKNFIELFQCSICNDIFDTVEGVSKHLEKPHSATPAKVLNAFPKSFGKQSNGTLKDRKTSERYCCVTHCHDCFPSEEELIFHAQQKHALKLKYNKEKSSSSKPYLCQVCFRTFGTLKNLKVHQFVRANNKQNRHFACAQCTFRAASRNLLAIHVRSKHSGERPFECSYCKKRFLSELHLKNHLICHSSERPFPCSLCEKVFSRKRNMEEHIRSCHSEDKPFHCSLCPAQFKVPQHLRIHARIHSGEKPYKCSFCDNSYYHISDRKRHEMVHTGEKPYHCSTCGAAFTRKRTLMSHKRTHTGERPFCCAICGKGFCQNATLKKHVERHRSNTANDLEKTVFCVEVFDDQGKNTEFDNITNFG